MIFPFYGWENCNRQDPTRVCLTTELVAPHLYLGNPEKKPHQCKPVCMHAWEGEEVHPNSFCHDQSQRHCTHVTSLEYDCWCSRRSSVLIFSEQVKGLASERGWGREMHPNTRLAKQKHTWLFRKSQTCLFLPHPCLAEIKRHVLKEDTILWVTIMAEIVIGPLQGRVYYLYSTGQRCSGR